MAFLNRGQASEAKMLASILVLVRGLGRTWAHSFEKTLMCRKGRPFCIQIDCSSRRHGSRKVQLETLEFFARWGCPVKFHNVALVILPMLVLSLSPLLSSSVLFCHSCHTHFSCTSMTISILHDPFTSLPLTFVVAFSWFSRPVQSSIYFLSVARLLQLGQFFSIAMVLYFPFHAARAFLSRCVAARLVFPFLSVCTRLNMYT